jgi:hypothetical protein
MRKQPLVSDFNMLLLGDRKAARAKIASAVEARWRIQRLDNRRRAFATTPDTPWLINLRTCAVAVQIEETFTVVFIHVVDVLDAMKVTWRGAVDALPEGVRGETLACVREIIEAASAPKLTGRITVGEHTVVFDATVIAEPLSCTVLLVV